MKNQFIPQHTVALEGEIRDLKTTISKVKKGKAAIKKEGNTTRTLEVAYPSNAEVAKFVDAVTDMKLNSTMSEAVKASACKIAGYLDFITGYWPDYEQHVISTTVTPEDVREATRDSVRGGKEWDYWPEAIQRKVLRHFETEHKQRVNTVKEMGDFLKRQQETMATFSPEAANRMEAIQEALPA